MLSKKCFYFAIDQQFLFISLQVWFKNRRAKVRQQQTHQQSSNANSLKSSNRSSASCSSSSSSTRHSASVGNSNTNNNNSKSSNVSGMSSSGALTKTTNSTTSMKHGQGGTSQTTSSNSSNHLAHQNSNNNNNNTSNTNNGLAAIGHNSSPILPMTPTSSVSPPVNVICKKELNTNYHSGNNGVPGLTDVMKSASMHDSLKEEMAGMVANPGIAYSNINARLGHCGNSTPLGSNSSVITTPSPPMTPSQNALSYVPNHETYFWHSQYNQYPNSYNTPASYYSQVDYQSQSNYSMGHSGYSTSNMGLSSGNTFNGSMASQPFAPNGIDYVNMV